MEFSRAKILSRQGRRLSTLDVHDLVCKIGEIVVCGGVRRSALISLSDLDDPEMRDAKKGEFYVREPQRSMANNSVAYNEMPDVRTFLNEWLSLVENGSGERGIFNRGGLKNQLPKRRLDSFKPYLDNCGTNPCVPGDTWVATANGPQRVSELVDKSFSPMVNGVLYKSNGFFKTGERTTYQVRTRRGYEFRATENHRVLKVEYLSRKVQQNQWFKLNQLKIGDRIVLNNHQSLDWQGGGTFKTGWLLGSLLGDGNIEKRGYANLDYWGTTQRQLGQQALQYIHEEVGARRDLVGTMTKNQVLRVRSSRLCALANSYNLYNQHKYITDNIETTSSDFHRGFLRGWFDADGSVQGTQQKGVSVRLASSNLSNLKAAQRMLARLGVLSTVFENRRSAEKRFLPDGKGGRRLYDCQADHELVVAGSNIDLFSTLIGFSDFQKNAKLQARLANYRRRLNRERFFDEIIEIKRAGLEDVFDCQVPEANAFDANGFMVHNCGEIVLRSKQFCNLSEIVARADDTEADLLRKARLATILGTYQSTLTNFAYLSKEWQENCQEERLLGVSITGQWDCPTVRRAGILRKLKAEVNRVSQMYAQRFDINPSTCTTCVKPSGTVSQLVDAASGMHPRHDKYYIRRVRISATDSLYKMLRDQGVPYFPEVGQTMDTATTLVLEFPVKAPDGAIFKDDVSALEQLEHWRLVKQNYTEHNPSVTVSVGENEWLETANWVYGHWDIIGGLSFLPRADHVYKLAPYEEIDEARYLKILARFEHLDYSKIMTYEQYDDTQGAKKQIKHKFQNQKNQN